MTPATIPAIEKAPYGTPCNGCGVCCIAEPCDLATAVLPEARSGRPCPALGLAADETETLFACGLVAAPEDFLSAEAINFIGRGNLIEAAKFLTGTGDGCDARLNGEPDAPPEYLALMAKKRRMVAEVTTSLALWVLASGRATP